MTSLAVLVFIGLSWSCDKKRQPPEYFLSPEVKEYMFFKAGTYWKYKDTATGEIRSIYVLSDTIYMHENLTHSGEVIAKRETFNWVTSKTEFTGHALSKHNAQDSIISASVTESLRGINEGVTYVFFYPFILNESLRPGSTFVTLTDIHDSLTVLGNVYYDVVEFHDDANSIESQYKTVTYVARNYGIVRKDIHVEEKYATQSYWLRYMLYDSNIKQ